MNEKENGKIIIKNLIEKFERNYGEYINPNYNETKVRTDFINPFLNALGWDVYNASNAKQHLRDVVEEDTVKVEELGKFRQKKPDYALRHNGNRKMFIEVKKPSVNIRSLNDPAFQVRRYGWSANLPISILTNFEYFIIYDCRYKPEEGDDVRVAKLKEYSFKELLSKYDEIYDEYSKEAVYNGTFDEIYNVATEITGTDTFDKYFLMQIEQWRYNLAENIHSLNTNLSNEELNFLVQRFINRIVFLRICEDRELEKYKTLLSIKNYQELKSLFESADKKYNSGLFNFIEDKLSLNINIDSSIIIKIFKELYYPNSPYAFSVVESNILGEIYEQFLAKEIIISNNIIVLRQKPEVAESNGVVTTPKYIVDAIVKRTLGQLIEGKKPAEIEEIKIADISCGSGVFLLGAFDYLLNYHLQWYIENEPSKYPDKLNQNQNGDWNLTLKEKQNILLRNIYGVDIDIQAVEVAQFSLLLKVLENEDLISVQTVLGENLKVLPNLKKNIIFGNSLVDNKIYDLQDSLGISEKHIDDISPFEWEIEFEDIMNSGGFDIIIGNPPYIRIQNMVKYSPFEVKFYRSVESGYECAESDNFDKYYLFIERSIDLLKPSGLLGYIVPNKFLTIKAGTSLRKLIAQNNHLDQLVHFGVEQVFKKRTTYTCILIISKLSRQHFTVEHVTALQKWIYQGSTSVERFEAKNFNEEPWIFLHPKVKEIFERISKGTEPLKNFADIFVGIQTSKDPVYVVLNENEQTNTISITSKFTGKKYFIEKRILRPFILDEIIEAFSTPKSNSYLIFPYKDVSGSKAIPFTENELLEAFPYCYNYLLDHKNILDKRAVSGKTEDTWFRFGRSQSLTKFNGDSKLIWPVLSVEPRYTLDENNIVFSGGGNGPYYGLKNIEDDEHSLKYILAILSHPVIEAIIRTGMTSKFRGGYYSHGKQFIEYLPFKKINFDDKREVEIYNAIIKDVEELIKEKERLKKATIPQRIERSQRRIAAIRTLLNKKVEGLYGICPEDYKTISHLT